MQLLLQMRIEHDSAVINRTWLCSINTAVICTRYKKPENGKFNRVIKMTNQRKMDT